MVDKIAQAFQTLRIRLSVAKAARPECGVRTKAPAIDRTKKELEGLLNLKKGGINMIGFTTPSAKITADSLIASVNIETKRMFKKFPQLGKKAAKSKMLRTLEIQNAKNFKIKGKEAWKGIKGAYNKVQRRVGLAGKLKRVPELKFGKWGVSEDFNGIFRHEFGHSIHNGLSKKAKQDWFSDYVWIPSKDMKKQIGKYAVQNELEGFAEAFNAYTSPSYRRGMLPKSIEKFMDGVVKGRIK